MIFSVTMIKVTFENKYTDGDKFCTFIEKYTALMCVTDVIEDSDISIITDSDSNTGQIARRYMR